MKAAGSSFGAFVRASVFLLCFFSAVFYGADSIARLRDGHFRLYLEWERRIPFYPVAYLAYYSVALLPLLIPAFVRDEGDIRLWKRRMSLAIAIAGVAFVLFPAEIGYVPVTTEDWLVVRRLTPILTGRYNLAPSLHVALMIIIMHALWPHLHRRGRGLILAWGVVLPLSTLFTHQHHVLDVATGLLLGFLVCFERTARLWDEHGQEISEDDRTVISPLTKTPLSTLYSNFREAGVSRSLAQRGEAASRRSRGGAR